MTPALTHGLYEAFKKGMMVAPGTTLAVSAVALIGYSIYEGCK